MDQKVIALPRLNGLQPSLESTALKLMEETGELAQAIGKYRGLSGETQVRSTEEIKQNLAEELLDVAQTAVSMMYVLENDFQVDIDAALKNHMAKLKAKGYLTDEEGFR